MADDARAASATGLIYSISHIKATLQSAMLLKALVPLSLLWSVRSQMLHEMAYYGCEPFSVEAFACRHVVWRPENNPSWCCAAAQPIDTLYQPVFELCVSPKEVCPKRDVALFSSDFSKAWCCVDSLAPYNDVNSDDGLDALVDYDDDAATSDGNLLHALWHSST